jgi:hypothetical protein
MRKTAVEAVIATDALRKSVVTVAPAGMQFKWIPEGQSASMKCHPKAE